MFKAIHAFVVSYVDFGDLRVIVAKYGFWCTLLAVPCWLIGVTEQFWNINTYPASTLMWIGWWVVALVLFVLLRVMPFFFLLAVGAGLRHAVDSARFAWVFGCLPPSGSYKYNTSDNLRAAVKSCIDSVLLEQARSLRGIEQKREACDSADEIRRLDRAIKRERDKLYSLYQLASDVIHCRVATIDGWFENSDYYRAQAAEQA